MWTCPPSPPRGDAPGVAALASDMIVGRSFPSGLSASKDRESGEKTADSIQVVGRVGPENH